MTKTHCTGKVNEHCWDSGCKVPRECIDNAIAEATRESAFEIGAAAERHWPVVFLAASLLFLFGIVAFG